MFHESPMILWPNENTDSKSIHLVESEHARTHTHKGKIQKSSLASHKHVFQFKFS